MELDGTGVDEYYLKIVVAQRSVKTTVYADVVRLHEV